MRIIILIAVLSMVLLEVTDAVPKSSVGGPVTMLFIVFVAVLALALYDAWSQRRGVLGWIVSIFVALVGGYFGLIVGSAILESVLSQLDLGGPLASSQHPLRYIASAGMMLLALLGAWIALQIASRWR